MPFFPHKWHLSTNIPQPTSFHISTCRFTSLFFFLIFSLSMICLTSPLLMHIWVVAVLCNYKQISEHHCFCICISVEYIFNTEIVIQLGYMFKILIVIATLPSSWHMYSALHSCSHIHSRQDSQHSFSSKKPSVSRATFSAFKVFVQICCLPFICESSGTYVFFFFFSLLLLYFPSPSSPCLEQLTLLGFLLCLLVPKQSAGECKLSVK